MFEKQAADVNLSFSLSICECKSFRDKSGFVFYFR